MPRRIVSCRRGRAASSVEGRAAARFARGALRARARNLRAAGARRPVRATEMPQYAYGLIEMGLDFGVVLTFLIWQLVKTRASLKADRERAAREKAERDNAWSVRVRAASGTAASPARPARRSGRDRASRAWRPHPRRRADARCARARRTARLRAIDDSRAAPSLRVWRATRQALRRQRSPRRRRDFARCSVAGEGEAQRQRRARGGARLRRIPARRPGGARATRSSERNASSQRLVAAIGVEIAVTAPRQVRLLEFRAHAVRAARSGARHGRRPDADRSVRALRSSAF